MDLRNPGTLESFSSGKVPPPMSKPLKMFYKGEPLALGITQILTGIFEIAFAFVVELGDVHSFYEVQLKMPYWTGILYIISGSLSVAAAKNPRIPLVKGALGMNVMSAVVAGLTTVVSSISLAFVPDPSHYYGCDYIQNDTEAIQDCLEFHVVPYATAHGTVVILFMFTITEFVIAIVSAAFGCASICRNSYSETTIVIFQNTAEASALPAPAP